MKLFKIMTAFFLLIYGGVFAQEKPFTIDGTIQHKTSGTIYLYNGKGLDSAEIKNGRFSFKGMIEGPAVARLMMDRSGRGFDKYAELYIVPAQMQLSVDYNDFSESIDLKGSQVQKEADILRKSKANIMAELKPLQATYEKANLAYIAAIKAKKDSATLATLKDAANTAKDAMDPYIDEMRKIERDFMNDHPSSFVTASLLRYRISGMPLKEGEERFSKLLPEVQNSSLGKEIKKDLDGLKMGSPGAKAYVFSSTELSGEPLSLADFKGKYVLVDFWASWCVPCRKGNPNLLSLYSKYKDKGFEIIGVSDDDSNPDAWKKAVEKDGIGVWKHILRGLKMVDGPEMFDRSNDISDQYGIHTLPTKILIDPKGVIIGRYGGGGENDDAMDKKLAEIFE